VQVFSPAIESHIAAIAASVLSRAGMQRLMDVSDDAGIVFLDAQDYLC
jgi:hypothetical protein